MILERGSGRPRIPLARNAGERHARHHRGDRGRREDQRFLRRSRLAADLARAGHCLGDPRWAAAGGSAARGPAEAVSSWLAGAKVGTLAPRLTVQAYFSKRMKVTILFDRAKCLH